tara:strand:+ start:760 stop:870 length:111 start_codon:yes stop_codon:yes gene_type:complete
MGKTGKDGGANTEFRRMVRNIDDANKNGITLEKLHG